MYSIDEFLKNKIGLDVMNSSPMDVKWLSDSLIESGINLKNHEGKNTTLYDYYKYVKERDWTIVHCPHAKSLSACRQGYFGKPPKVVLASEFLYEDITDWEIESSDVLKLVN